MSTSTISITDASIIEGDDGSKTIFFVVSSSDDSNSFTIEFAATDGTATNVEDYLGVSGVS